MRFIVGPWSTNASDTFSRSRSAPRLFSAFAAAEATTLLTCFAARFGTNFRTASASSTYLPRTRSTTRRTFRGAIRTYRAIARASMSLCSRYRVLGVRYWVLGIGTERSVPNTQYLTPNTLFKGGTALRVAAVALEGARIGELAELVPDHVFRDKDRDVLAAVMDGEGMADHQGKDGRSTRPC